MTATGLAADVSTGATAGKLVNVTLVDDGHDGTDLGKNMGLGMAMGGDASKAVMSIKTDVFAVPAGLVTFRVSNASDHMVHEMLVVPVSSMTKPLPYNDKDNRVDEESAGDLGEVAELEPGKSGELTIELKSGLYMLLCNIPGHYAAGMWKVIAVQ
jgi:uncharacterized cupredoxin-like copper-binding protein